VAQILDGKSCASAVRRQLRAEVAELKLAGHPVPHIVFIQVGDNPASSLYVSSKQSAAEKAGMRSTIERLPDTTQQPELIGVIERLNRDSGVHGILVQLPLPPWIDSTAVAEAISPAKDVDCFHPQNVGKLALGLPGPKPATPRGILMLLKHYGIEVAGRHALIVGRSNLVGKPLGLMLLAEDATVIMCHSRTADLPALARQADILVAAAGKPGLITGAMVKPGAVVVDVGINYLTAEGDKGDETRLVGDVDYAGVEPVAGWISPVPGGVGPMTIASVLCNGLDLYHAAHVR
jgi:methylenetetrahydrofolate dehydrogenase (NADP+) / methenyltetrahydrofolate cyclohydrolase